MNEFGRQKSLAAFLFLTVGIYRPDYALTDPFPPRTR